MKSRGASGGTQAALWLRAFWLIAMLAIVLVTVAACQSEASAQEIELVPPSDEYPQDSEAMKAYAAEAAWAIEVTTDGAAPQAVRVTVPSPFAGGNTVADSILPTQPMSTIYRFKYMDIEAETEPAVPFRYLEIDWNTEGVPRGPNGAFVNPHYDFHFYLLDRAWVDEEMACPSSGRTCDSQQTGYAQMRRFLNMAPDRFVPGSYFPDTGSAIGAMGLHSLDGNFDFTEDEVNNNPIIIYGTFDGGLAFLEASLTLYAFQNAVELAQAGARSTWEIPQPAAYAYPVWPTAMSLEYLPEEDVFVFALAGMEGREVDGPE